MRFFLIKIWEVLPIKIVKVFNNNASLVMNNKQQEEVIMGSGIGYGLKPGDPIDQSKIEKRFIIEDQKSITDLEQLLERIDYQDFQLASDILNLFEEVFQKESSPALLLALADHISFALTRAKEGMMIRTPLEWEVKQVYPKEYNVGLQAVDLMNERLGIQIPQEEAAFITLHFVNFLGDNIGMEETLLVSKVIQNILTIINYHYGKEFKQDSIYFSRFITHIRYFVKRQLSGETPPREASSLLSIISLKYPNDFDCSVKIKKFLEDNYNWVIIEDEILYLTLHLNRLAS